METPKAVHPCEELKQEHRALLQKLGDFRKSIRARQSAFSAEAAPGLVSDLLHYFNAEMARHIYKEEKILFPAFEAAVGGGEKWLGQSKEVHRDLSADMDKAIDRIRSLGQELSKGATAEALPRLKELDKTLGFILRRWSHHTRLEEEYLFPEMERLISPETWHKIKQQMQ